MGSLLAAAWRARPVGDVTAQEMKELSAEQIAFLERKRGEAELRAERGG
jgi:hypothetical protein